MNYDILLARAEQASSRAYAAYSDFRVGAAALLSNGEIVEGNNQENVSYGLSICAERVVLNNIFASNPSARVTALAVVSPCTERLVSPCGACRQVMAEIVNRQGADFDVVMRGSDEGVVVKRVAELLPLAFQL